MARREASNKEFDRTNTAALWMVDSDNERAPLFQGVVNIDGEDHRIAFWPSKKAEECGDDYDDLLYALEAIVAETGKVPVFNGRVSDMDGEGSKPAKKSRRSRRSDDAVA